jgi:ParB-like nuclease domain
MLTPLSTDRFKQPSTEFSPGPAPQQLWLDVGELFVDDGYQRTIGKKGAENIRLIAERFDWSKFAPVIVAPLEGGGYAIVDGQHRTTAAMIRGLKRVPCHVVQADRAQQAAAFAAVNGNVTMTIPSQIFWAQKTAGDPLACTVDGVCKAADVTIIRSNKSLLKMKVGQTTAVKCLTRCVELYGPELMTTVLRCLTKTADGNAGFVRSSIIEAIAKVLHRNPHFARDEKLLLSVMQSWSWPDAWDRVADQLRASPYTLLDALVNHLEKFLTKRFEQMARKKAA